MLHHIHDNDDEENEGEEKEVSFLVTPRMMALIDQKGKCLLEPGMFEIYVGGSQPDERSQKLAGVSVLKGVCEVTGSLMELEY